jgi:hypothetical protein
MDAIIESPIVPVGKIKSFGPFGPKPGLVQLCLRLISYAQAPCPTFGGSKFGQLSASGFGAPVRLRAVKASNSAPEFGLSPKMRYEAPR